MTANAITPAQFSSLIDDFPSLVEQLAALDEASGPMHIAATRILMSDKELLRRLAAIGRGVPVEEVRPGTFGNMIAALACLTATGASQHTAELIQIFSDRVGFGGGQPPRAVLRLVGGTEA